MKKTTIGYIKELDILRFLAATGVILHHTSLNLQRRNLEFLVMHRGSGNFFLNLFFVISGFLISSILFKEIDTGQFSYKNFFTRRILRIWPLYFFIVILFVLVIPLLKGFSGSEITHNVLFASLFIVNFQVLFSTITKTTYVILWSVGIEEHIYIIFPFLLFMLKKKRIVLAVILVALGFLSWMIGPAITDMMGSKTNFQYFFTPSYFYYFGAGCLVAIIVTLNGTNIRKADSFVLHPLVHIILVLLGFICVFNPNFNSNPEIIVLLFNFIFAAYLVYCAARKKSIFGYLPVALSRYLGNVSYAMYLLHIQAVMVGFFIIKKMGGAPTPFKFNVLLPVIILAITVLASTICHFLIERPFLKLKKKFTTVSNK